MPGVLIIEAMAQACAVLAMSRLTEEQKKEKALFYFAGIDEARFKRVVIPGDQLIFECKYIKDRAGIGWYEAVATVDGHVAATAKMMCARRPVEICPQSVEPRKIFSQTLARFRFCEDNTVQTSAEIKLCRSFIRQALWIRRLSSMRALS